MTSARAGIADRIQEKIRQLITEFTQGSISAEQFDLLYDRYSNQLSLATMPHLPDQLDMNDAVTTIALRQATNARAVGVCIYHHRSGIILETLGRFDVAPYRLSRMLKIIGKQLAARAYVASQTEKIDGGRWLAYIPRTYTTAVFLFYNEPPLQHIRILERLHHDFEAANQQFLNGVSVDTTQLARPYAGIVSQPR